MERKASRTHLISAILVFVLLMRYSSFAQEVASHPPKHFTAPNPSAMSDGSPNEDVEVLKRNLRSQKKQVIAANMKLTDAEAEKFWPVYDRYDAELAGIYDTKMALVEEYLANFQTMSGDEAESYIRRRAAVEQDVMQLRLKYVPQFRKVLSGREAALFFQIDWRLELMINLQLAQIPVIDP